MNKLLNETKVRIENVRASYEHLIKPAAFPGAEPKYSLSAIIDKKDEEAIKVIKEAIKNAEARGVEKYGQKFAKAKKHNPIHDGDVERAEDVAYENAYYFNCSNKTKPTVLDATTGLQAEESDIYSGMYGKLIVNFYPYYASAASCGVSASLLGFQKTKDAEPLGGVGVSDTDFEDEEEGLLD